MAKVLVIEDDELMIKALEFRLKKDGYDVYLARDGAEGIEMLSKTLYDLVITDIMMPFVSGLEVVSHIKNNPVIKNTPVIVLSSIGLERVLLEAFELGGDDFIIKPFNLSELVSRVRKFVSPTEALVRRY
ncbi:response regulator [Pedobacter sp. P351]|uniref:response regulator transcription factor n=1 Tax=Pedobacter superstes TaxID=3133441 RepID=UPI0030AD3BCC